MSVKDQKSENNSRKNKKAFFKKFLIAIIILVLILLITIGAFVFWIKTTPQYAMSRWLVSIREKDYDSFISYIDLDKVANSRIQKEIERLNLQDSQTDILALKNSFLTSLKSNLEKDLEESIKSGLILENLKKEYPEISREIIVPGMFFSLDWESLDENKQKVKFKNSNQEFYLVWQKSNQGDWQIIEINPITILQI
jgi:hypothetical protein